MTTLKPLISGTLAFSQSPIAAPVASGLVRDTLKRGKTTSVKSPSNSLRVSCTCRVEASTLVPYISDMACAALVAIKDSGVISLSKF